MKKAKVPFSKIVLFLGLFLFVLPKHAEAYLDPGTGSYVLQIIAAVFFGGVYFITAGWKHIRMFISKLFSGKDQKSEKSNDKKE